MIAGNSVRPKKWSEVLDLFDDGVNSYIVGYYKDLDKDCIGVRWNGDLNNPKEIGYPRHADYPTWFVLPEYLNNQTLQTLQSLVSANPNLGSLANITAAVTRLN